MTKNKYLASALTTLVFIALILIFLLALPVSANNASADSRSVEINDLSFTYDGSVHTVTASTHGFTSPSFAWYKDGDSVPRSTAAVLEVRDVSDGGEYLLNVSEEEFSLSATCNVTIERKEISIIWRKRNNITSSPFMGDDYTYNGNPQGVFPFLTGVAEGDGVSPYTVGNTQTAVGEYTARILSLTGADANNYILEGDEEITYSIVKAPLVATVPNKRIFFGDEYEGEVILEGFLGDDDESDVTGSFVTDYVKGSPSDTYTVTYAVASHNYYLSAVTPGVIAVEKCPVTVRMRDSESVYGEPLSFSSEIEGAPEEIYPRIRFYLTSEHVGTHEIFADVTDDNFEVTFRSATYTVTPRPIEVELSASEVVYGDVPTFEATAVNGSFPAGKDISDLQITCSPLPKGAVGTFPVYGEINSPDYTGKVTPCNVTVVPKPITVKIKYTVSFYGDPFSTPSITVSPLPYGETVSDLALSFTTPSSNNCGKYRILAVSGNPCYEVVPSSDTNYNYSIEKKYLQLNIEIPDSPVIKEGETVKYPFSLKGVVGTDKVSATVYYEKLNDRGTAESRKEEITEPGVYSIYVTLDDPTGNYGISSSFPTFEVYGDRKEVGEITVVADSGLTDKFSAEITEEDKKSYVEKYSGTSFTQSIFKVFKMDVKGVSDSQIEIWVPVDDENRYYTVGIEKENGEVVYVPCTVKNGYAVFRTSSFSGTVMLWKDNDGSTFSLLALILLIFLVIEIAVFVTLYSKYKNRKKYAYALLPIAATLSPVGAGIYYFIAACAVEAIAIVGFLIGILILVAKLNKIKNKKFR